MRMTPLFRHRKFELLSFRLGMSRGMLKPLRLVPHVHLTVLDGGPVLPEIATTLHTNLGPILPVIEPGFQALTGSAALRWSYS